MAAPSFPDVHVTGPVHHFVRAVNSGDTEVYYLGTAEVTPQIQTKKYTKDVKNTIAGSVLPFQRTYQGQAATVSVALTYYSKIAHNLLLVSDAGLGNVFAEGQESRWSRGHLVFGQSTFELWQVFENFFNPNVATLSSNLEIGYYWPQVELVEDPVVAAGTQEQLVMMLFDCQPKWVQQASLNSVNSALNERGWFLYSQDPAYFPQSVRVPQ